MKSLAITFFTIATFLVTFASCGGEKTEEPLMCHVGGTMRPVVQKLAEIYKEKTGEIVHINSAGSGELLAHIEMQKEGDLYVCHDPFLDILMHKKLGIDGWVIAELTPIILVQKGNPKNIKGLVDLQRKDIELALTDYRLSSLGRMLETIFKKAGIDLKEMQKSKEIVTNKSGSYVGNLVKMKSVDAGIVWKAVAVLREDATDFVEITKHLPVPFVDTVTSATKKEYKLTPMRVTIATIKCSKQQAKANKFAEFLLSDESIETFKKYGFDRNNKDILGQKYKNGIKTN